MKLLTFVVGLCFVAGISYAQGTTSPRCQWNYIRSDNCVVNSGDCGEGRAGQTADGCYEVDSNGRFLTNADKSFKACPDQSLCPPIRNIYQCFVECECTGIWIGDDPVCTVLDPDTRIPDPDLCGDGFYISTSFSCVDKSDPSVVVDAPCCRDPQPKIGGSCVVEDSVNCVGTVTITDDSYVWVTGDWGLCRSSTAGCTGTQIRPVRCIKESTNEVVPSDLCPVGSRPVFSQECKIESDACSSVSTCDWVSTGDPVCSVKDGDEQFIDDCGIAYWFTPRECQNEQGQLCDSIKCPILNTRLEPCVDPCPTEKPADPVADDAKSCKWVASDPSECIATFGVCGSGVIKRTVTCVQGVVDVEESCCKDNDPEIRPRESTQCVVECCKWIPGTWSDCVFPNDATCGSNGIQTRTAVCMLDDENLVTIELGKTDYTAEDISLIQCCQNSLIARVKLEYSSNVNRGLTLLGFDQSGSPFLKQPCSEACDDNCQIRKHFVKCLPDNLESRCGSGSSATLMQCVDSAGLVSPSFECCGLEDYSSVNLGTSTFAVEYGERCSIQCGSVSTTTVAEGESYSFQVGAFGPCSARCGKGVRRRTVKCLRTTNTLTEEVLVSKCEAVLAESYPTTAECLGSCDIRWEIDSSKCTACSAPCDGGFTECDVTCFEATGDGVPAGTFVWDSVDGSESQTGYDGSVTYVAVDDGVCKNIPLPQNRRTRCNTNPCVYRWITEQFSECSAKCDGGIRTRIVTCVNASGAPVAESNCEDLRKPEDTEQCNTRPCVDCSTAGCNDHGDCVRACNSDGTSCAHFCKCATGFSGASCETAIFSKDDVLVDVLPQYESCRSDYYAVPVSNLFSSSVAFAQLVTNGIPPLQIVKFSTDRKFFRFNPDEVLKQFRPGFGVGDGRKWKIIVVVNARVRIESAEFEIVKPAAGDDAICATDKDCGDNRGQCCFGKCFCHPGFDGATCQVVDPCAQTSCVGSSECRIDDAGVASCECLDGFTGPRCDIPVSCDVSENLECVNGAVSDDCSECNCIGGWEGLSCADCNLDCGEFGKPGERCLRCICDEKHYGDRCEHEIYLIEYPIETDENLNKTELLDIFTKSNELQDDKESDDAIFEDFDGLDDNDDEEEDDDGEEELQDPLERFKELSGFDYIRIVEVEANEDGTVVVLAAGKDDVADEEEFEDAVDEVNEDLDEVNSDVHTIPIFNTKSGSLVAKPAEVSEETTPPLIPGDEETTAPDEDKTEDPDEDETSSSMKPLIGLMIVVVSMMLL
jgi:hypothetical protein